MSNPTDKIESYCVTRKDFDIEEEETDQKLWDAFMEYDDERDE